MEQAGLRYELSPLECLDFNKDVFKVLPPPPVSHPAKFGMKNIRGMGKQGVHSVPFGKYRISDLQIQKYGMKNNTGNQIIPRGTCTATTVLLRGLVIRGPKAERRGHCCG